MGRGEASDLWGGDATASTVATFPLGKCSDLQLDLSAIAWVRRSLTFATMLTLGFGGVLGELAAGMMCASSTGKVVHLVPPGRWRNIDPHVWMLVCGNASTAV